MILVSILAGNMNNIKQNWLLDQCFFGLVDRGLIFMITLGIISLINRHYASN